MVCPYPSHLWQRLDWFFLLIYACLLNPGCAGSSQPALPNSIQAMDTQCTTGMAQILVGDGFMRILCGCTGTAETDGTYIQAPTSLTCHLSSGSSVVLFHLTGTVNRHQIVSTGTPTFVPSAVSDPSSGNPITVYTAFFPQTSTTYSFADSFNSAIQGQIVIP